MFFSSKIYISRICSKSLYAIKHNLNGKLNECFKSLMELLHETDVKTLSLTCGIFVAEVISVVYFKYYNRG